MHPQQQTARNPCRRQATLPYCTDGHLGERAEVLQPWFGRLVSTSVWNTRWDRKKARLVECTVHRRTGLHYVVGGVFSCSMAAKGGKKFASLVQRLLTIADKCSGLRSLGTAHTFFGWQGVFHTSFRRLQLRLVE